MNTACFLVSSEIWSDAFAPTGRCLIASSSPGRFPGLCSSAPSGRTQTLIPHQKRWQNLNDQPCHCSSTNFVSSKIWSDASAPSGRKTIGENGYTTSATKSTYLHHAAIYHHSKYRLNLFGAADIHVRHSNAKVLLFVLIIKDMRQKFTQSFIKRLCR